MNEPIVLIGGYGSHWKDYRQFGRALAQVSGRRIFIVSISRVTWLVADYTDYILLVHRTHQAVLHALEQTGVKKVMLVGHSAGGIVARAYLADHLRGSNHTPYHGFRRVARMVTLGSPLSAVEHPFNTGLRQAAWLDREFPGAFYAPDVQYLTVHGRLIEGKIAGTLAERRAYRAYQFISGEGAQWGDGVVPNSISRITGVASLELERVGHSPWWGPRWYGGDVATIRMWWDYFDQGDAPALETGRMLA
jgi:pimeloyl-ACP methyl ester carboxylesterase